MSNYFVQPEMIMKQIDFDVYSCVKPMYSCCLLCIASLLSNDHGPGGRSPFVEIGNEAAVSVVFLNASRLNSYSWDDVYE